MLIALSKVAPPLLKLNAIGIKEELGGGPAA